MMADLPHLTMNTYTGTDRLNSYAQEKKWPISWDPAVGIGEHPHTHLWIVKCTGVYPDIWVVKYPHVFS